MDVTCERCSTEYDFDDALVSERGTTVKCTNCGYQFKVRRTDSTLPEKWLVRTVDGRELEFTLLRELQAAIARAEITREDVLSRGGSRPRRLGSIAELEPFFGSLGGVIASSTAHGLGGGAPTRARKLTPQGLGPSPGEAGTASPEEAGSASPEGGSSAESPEELLGGAAADPQSDAETVVPEGGRGLDQAPPSSQPVPSPAGRIPIFPGTLPGIVVPPEEAPPLPEGYLARRVEPAAPAGGTEAEGAPTLRGSNAGAGEAGGEASATAPDPTSRPVTPALPPVAVVRPVQEPVISEVRQEGDEAVTTPRQAPSSKPRSSGGRRPLSVPPLTPTPPDVRTSFFEEGYAEPRFSTLAPSKRPSAARWIVGLVMAGLALLAMVTLAPRYVKTGAPAPASASDERVPTLLAEGERSLLDGDLETAREKFVKASALAENAPRVAASLARVDTVSADIRWLKVRLLARDDPDFPIAEQELKIAIERARKAVEHAGQVAEGDPVVTRSRIDLLRIEGDLSGARKLVGTPSGGSAQPENALTLAALDLAEAEPSWAAVLERLRTAASGEQNLGRARALLVYALVRAGDLPGARAEYERIAAMSRPHPLLRWLRNFLQRAEGGEGGQDKPAADAGLPDAAAGADRRGGDDAAEPPKTTREPATPLRAPAPGAADRQDGRVPDEYAVPGGNIDTSDLPGVPKPPAPPPSSPSPPAASPARPENDPSDLPR